MKIEIDSEMNKEEKLNKYLEMLSKGREYDRTALSHLKTERLYEELGYESFNDCLLDPRIGWKKTSANHEVRAAQVEMRLKMPIGTNVESVYRGLGRLNDDALHHLWSAVEKLAKEREVDISGPLVTEARKMMNESNADEDEPLEEATQKITKPHRITYANLVAKDFIDVAGIVSARKFAEEIFLLIGPVTSDEDGGGNTKQEMDDIDKGHQHRSDD